jgi:hypothetical protein
MVRPCVLAWSRLYPNVPAVDAADIQFGFRHAPHLAVPGRPLVDRGDAAHRRERNSRALVPSRTNRVILDFFGPTVPRKDNGPKPNPGFPFVHLGDAACSRKKFEDHM